jgi:methanethiol S-methyltransferase
MVVLPRFPNNCRPKEQETMKRITIFVYGTLSYLTCLATFLYLAGFIGNFGVPKSMDSPAKGP